MFGDLFAPSLTPCHCGLQLGLLMRVSILGLPTTDNAADKESY